MRFVSKQGQLSFSSNSMPDHSAHTCKMAYSLMKLVSYPILTSYYKCFFFPENHSNKPYHSWEFTAPHNNQCTSILPPWSSRVTRKTTLSSQRNWAPVGDGWSIFDRATISDNNYPESRKWSPHFPFMKRDQGNHCGDGSLEIWS